MRLRKNKPNKMRLVGMAVSFFTMFSAASITTGQGTSTNIIFYSPSLEMERNVQIYLPEGYAEQDSARYPVLYFLHGADQNSTSNSVLFSIYNNLTENKEILPCIIVKPDGSCPPWGRSYYSNSELYGNFEDYIVYDLLAYIDSAYNTISSREKRAIMGYSMGAYGAMKLALKHPDIFCGVAAHSGFLNMRMCSQFISSVLSENGGAPVHEYSPNAGPWTYGSFAVTGALSPNLDHPPYYVDFPLDSMGNWIDSVWMRWSAENCPSLARNLSEEDDLAIYFDCGTQDEFLSYAFNTSFADSLDHLGIPYEFQSFTGGHSNQLSTRFPIALKFLDSVMNPIGIEADSCVWTYKTPMPTGRGFTSGAVVDGKIYMIGGFPTHTSVTNANEMYDPATDTWSPMAGMPEGRCANASCTYDGKIYVFGGINSNPYANAQDNVYVYDPQTDTWTQKAGMPYENAFAGVAVVEDTIYLIGGMRSYNSPPISTLMAYYPLTDTWEEKASMPTARGMLSACAVDGKIYAIGGTKAFLTSTYNMLEVYDPATNTWTEGPGMPTARVAMASCVMDGKIFAIGGYNYPVMYTNSEMYDPASDTWITKTPMQETRQLFFLGTVGERIYAIGGSYPNPKNPAEPVILSSVEVYGPTPEIPVECDTWTTKASMPTARGFTTGAILDGKIYMSGGLSDSNSTSSAMEMFDPSTNSWFKRADMPEGRVYHASCSCKGKVYVFGGIPGDLYGTAEGNVYEYNPETDIWTRKADMPISRAFCAISTLNDTIYLIGGGLQIGSIPVSTVMAYTPETDSWSEKASIPTARFCSKASVVDGKIYVVGGTNQNYSSVSYKMVEIYDPETNSWTTGAEMPTGRFGLGTCVVNGKIYAAGGMNSGNVLTTNEVYDPHTNTWESLNPLQQKRFQFLLAATGDIIYAVGGAYPNPQNQTQAIVLSSTEAYAPCYEITGNEEDRFTTELPGTVRLSQNYPNPFISNTVVPYSIGKQQKINISVFNIQGQQVAELLNEVKSPGDHTITLDSGDLPEGIYLIRFKAGNSIQTIKCALLRH